VRPDQFSDVATIVITHEHPDHLNVKALTQDGGHAAVRDHRSRRTASSSTGWPRWGRAWRCEPARRATGISPARKPREWVHL
jgi:L-ascorbate metabolism protein UlaG (beta-lactamase superfamily)